MPRSTGPGSAQRERRRAPEHGGNAGPWHVVGPTVSPGPNGRSLRPGTHDLDRVLLEAKLRVPPLQQPSVSRAALVQRVRASGCRTVCITAPAGYGKSTFLAEWAGLETRRVGWLSLDRFDDDPETVLRLLAMAYARVDPERTDLAAEVRGSGGPVLSRAAPRLAAAFASSPEPFVLILDDLHELHSAACYDVLDVVNDGIPPGSQLVTSSRSEQPHTARRRPSGDQLEVTAADLALDPAGAQRVFSSLGVSLSAELASVVSRRTEGWPTGVYLAAMIAKDHPDDLGTVTGDDRYIADYLYRECLDRQPDDMQWFLCRTAVLGRLCGPLSDAVLGGSDGAERLRRLESSSMFVIALERQREWYRYHSLFREFLLAELHRRASPAEIEKLHLRAADWYEANGSPRLALEHLLETTERDRSLQLISSLSMETYQAGELATLRRWLGVVGAADIERYPPLAVTAAWAALLTGDTLGAERWSAFVDSASFADTPTDGTASYESARAMLRAAMCAHGPEAMRSDAALAVSREPIWGAYHDTAVWLLAEAHLLAGDTREAHHWFSAASDAATNLHHPTSIVMCQSEMALLDMDRGDWHEAAAHLEVARSVVDQHRLEDYAVSLLVAPGAARLALHRGDLAGTEQALAQAMRARPLATYAMPFLAVRVRIELAKVYVALCDRTTPRHLVREIDDILLRRPLLGALLEQLNDLRGLLVSTAAVGSGPSPLTAAELRLLPYLQTHLTLGAIAERLYVSRNTVSSQVASIYRKLGVCSRREAVAEATAIGLIGG